MRCLGIRGATTVEENTKSAILSATRELLEKIIEANQIEADEVASAFFTTTPDLNAEFPAVAAREIGWTNTALLCGHEMAVPGSLPMCLRLLILYNTEKTVGDITHIYIRGAAGLRPDKACGQ